MASVSMAASLSAGGYTVTNGATPVNASDLATKAYIDAKVGGIGGFHDVNWLQAVNIAATSGLALADGTATAGDLVLCTAQTTQNQNGPWVVASGAWSRPSWWASATVVNNGQYFLVEEGTTYKDSKWFCTTLGTITVDTTSMAFSQDLSGSTYTAGTGLQLVGGAFSVLYGTTSTTAAAGNDARITGALQASALGANVQTALGVAVRQRRRSCCQRRRARHAFRRHPDQLHGLSARQPREHRHGRRRPPSVSRSATAGSPCSSAARSARRIPAP